MGDDDSRGGRVWRTEDGIGSFGDLKLDRRVLE